MAKDEFDLDDLDFDGIDFESGDFSVDPIDSKSRKPIERFARSFAEGALDITSDVNFIRRITRQALPKEYEGAFDIAESAADTARSLYDSASSDLAPALREARLTARRFLPRVKRFLPESLAEKLDRLLKDIEERDRMEKLDHDEMTIKVALADIFKEQASVEDERYAREETRELLRDKQSDKRHRETIEQQQSIQEGISRLVGYQDRVTANYQKKSLELQYRHYFAARDLLEHFKASSADIRERLEAIVKNTALPDVVKIHLSELSGRMLKERLIGNIQQTILDQVGGFGNRLRENLANRVKDFSQNLADNISMAAMMADQMSAMGDMPGVSPGEMAAQQLGGGVAGWLAQHLAKMSRDRLGKVDAVNRVGQRVAYFSQNAPELFNEWLTNQSEREYDLSDDGSLLTRQNILTAFARMAREVVPAFQRDAGAGVNLFDTADEAVSFNRLTRQTITEIIPGYLSRIHHELHILRTGDETVDRLVYNLDRQSFTDLSTARRDVRDRVLSKSTLGSANAAFGEAVDQIDPDNKLSKEARKALIEQLADDTSRGLAFNPLRYTKPEGFTRPINDKLKQELQQHFQATFTDGDGKLLNTTQTAEQIRKAAARVKEAQSQLPDVTRNITAYFNFGQADLLRDLGIVTRDGKRDVISYDYIWKQIADASPEVGTTNDQADQGAWKDSLFNRLYDRYRPRFGRQRAVAPGDETDTVVAVSEEEREETEGLRDRLRRYTEQAQNYLRQRAGKIAEKHLSAEQREQAAQLLESGKERVLGAVDRARAEAAEFKADPSAYVETRKESARGKMAQLKQQVEALKAALVEKQETVWRPLMAQAKVGYDRALDALTKRTGVTREKLEGLLEKAEGQAKSLGDKAKVNYDQAIEALVAQTGLTKQRLEELLADAKEREATLTGTVQERVAAQRTAFTTKRQAAGIATSEEIALSAAASPAVGEKRWEQPSQGQSLSLDGLVEQTDRVVSAIEAINPLNALEQTNLTLAEILVAIQSQGGGGAGGAGSPGFFRSMRGKVGSALGSMIQGAGSFYKKTYQGLGSLTRGGLTGLGGMFAMAGNFMRSRGGKDIYVKGNPEPVLLARDLALGVYRDTKTGKPIRSLEDVKAAQGPIADADGNIVVTVEDLEKGLYTRSGESIVKKAAGFVKGYYGMYFNAAGAALNVAKTVIRTVRDTVRRQTDIYVSGEPTPRLLATVMVAGGYLSKHNLKPIYSIEDIDGDVIDRSGNVVLTLADMQKGLVDKHGKPIRGLAGKVADLIKSAAKLPLQAAQLYGRAVKGVVNMGREFLSGMKGGLGISFGGGDVGVKQLDVLKQIRDILDERLRKPESIRSGSWQERLGAGGRYTGPEKVERTESKAGRNLLEGLGGGLKRMFGFGGGGPDIDIDTGGRRRRPGRKGGSRLGRLARGAGRFAGKALSVGARLALPVAGALASGIGSAASGAAAVVGGATSAIGAVLSAPVMLGAAAVAAVAAGGYFLYKHLSKKKLEPLEKVRYLQYGVDPDGDKERLQKVMYLEKELEDNVSIGNGNSASLRISDEEALKLAKGFGVDTNDPAAMNGFMAWMSQRFRPTYLNHMAALKEHDQSVELHKAMGKLTAKQKLAFLRRIKRPIAEPDPSTVRISPFETNEQLKIGSAEVAAAINAAEEHYKAAVDKEEKKGTSNKRSPASTAGALPTAAVAAVIPEDGTAGPIEQRNPGTGMVDKLTSEATTAAKTTEALALTAAVPDVASARMVGALTGKEADKSADPAEAKRKRAERSAVAIEAQVRAQNEALNKSMEKVLDVLNRSYLTQVSMDKNIQEINRYFKAKAEKERKEEMDSRIRRGEFFSFGRSRPAEPAPAPVIDLSH